MITEKEAIRLLIADDHQIVIDGIKSILEHDPLFQVVLEAKDGSQVIEKVKNAAVDIAILDINMPFLNGVEVTRILKKEYPEIKILILTMYNDAEFIKNLMEAGADGFVLKNTGRKELVGAIQRLKDGGTYFGQEVTGTLARSYKRKKNDVIRLTRREVEVLHLLAEGLTTSEISDKLFISKHTADSHRKNLLSKLNAKNTATLLKKAFQLGYINFQ